MTRTPSSELALTLYKLRLARKLTRPQLVAKLGVSQNYVSVIETGRRIPRPAMLARIAQALEVDYVILARLAGYAPAAIGEYTVTTTSLEKAAWLRQLEARFEADDLEQLYAFGLRWQPRQEAEAAESEPVARRRATG